MGELLLGKFELDKMDASVNADNGNAVGKSELKKLLTEVLGLVMLHLSEELIFFHGAVVGGALCWHTVVAFPRVPLSAPNRDFFRYVNACTLAQKIINFA